MDIIQRAKNICLTPKTEWPVIAAEPATSGALLTGYAAPLAAIGAVCGFIGRSLIGTTVPFIGHYRTPFFTGIVGAIFAFGMALVACFVLGFIINALAPTFGGQKNPIQALKVAVYAYTPAWIAGVLQIVPLLGILGIFAALYALYLLYLGLPRLMGAPEDKAIPYTAVVVLCAIVLGFVIAAIGGLMVGAGAIGGGALMGAGGIGGGASASASPGTSGVQFDKNSTMGKLQDFGKALEASNKKMDEAAKSGDANAQAAAAAEGLGMLLGGGKRVDPVEIDQLKPLVPETFGGLPKTSSSAEKAGIAGLMMSKAEASYSDAAGKTVTLEISDTGGVSGITALVGWSGIQGEREDANGSERTEKINGRLTHEKRSKTGGSNEYSVVIADRFVVTATGRGVDFASLKTGVSGLDLGKLEGMKAAGVGK